MSQPEIQKTSRLMQGTQMAKERWPEGWDGQMLANLTWAMLVWCRLPLPQPVLFSVVEAKIKQMLNSL